MMHYMSQKLKTCQILYLIVFNYNRIPRLCVGPEMRVHIEAHASHCFTLVRSNIFGKFLLFSNTFFANYV